MSHIQHLICRQGNFELNIPYWEWPDGKISALRGASGSGKSTLVLSLCGLKPIAKGFKWIFKGEDLSKIPPPKRHISLLFQDLVLFANMSARENIVFPAHARKLPIKTQAQRMELLTEHLELTPFLHKKVALLSGGEQKRVALARALIQPSRFLILDEPFSSLNQELKTRAIALCKTLQAEDKCSLLLISHSEEDIAIMAQKKFYINNGRLQSSACPGFRHFF